MATRSRIGIRLSDDSILSAYHHWDSYPEWLGKKLVEHYSTKDKVSELIDGGDMSSCWTDERWNNDINQYGGKTCYLTDTFGPQYYSERGEDVPPRLDKDLFEYLSNSEEYSYLWENGKWLAFDTIDESNSQEVEIPQ